MAMERFLGVSIIILRVDNAPEYIHGLFEDYYKMNGLTYEKMHHRRMEYLNAPTGQLHQ